MTKRGNKKGAISTWVVAFIIVLIAFFVIRGILQRQAAPAGTQVAQNVTAKGFFTNVGNFFSGIFSAAGYYTPSSNGELFWFHLFNILSLLGAALLIVIYIWAFNKLRGVFR